jgi:chorismate--pyruvate lyase
MTWHRAVALDNTPMTALPPAAGPFRYHPDPVWKPRGRIRQGQLPADLRPWLLDTASLTQRVISICSGQFSVRVLSQRWTRPMRNECLRLGMQAGGHALVRQVELLCNDVPLVYARTVIPRSTLRGRAQRLAKLGSRSLGATLFADPAMRRSELELVRLSKRDALFARLVDLDHAKADCLWGRRSVFTLSGKPLLVSEIFLPEIRGKRF